MSESGWGSGWGWAALVMGLAIAGPTGCEQDDGPVTSPQPVSLESPFRYPLELWDAGESGETLLMILVSDVGAVDSVYVLESSGQAGFDSAAVAGARELKFAPGRRGDRRVAMWTRLPVQFRRDDPETGDSNE